MKARIAPFAAQGVCLRLLRSEDLPATLAWRNRDDARIWFKTPSIITPEQHQAWFRAYEGKDDDYVFIIETKQIPVGQASVYNIKPATQSAEIGRFLAAPEHRGQGYVDTACAALIALCKTQLSLSHIYLEVLPQNQRAIRLYQHYGFAVTDRQEHLLRMELHL